MDALLALGGTSPAEPVAWFMRGFLAVLKSDPASAAPALERAAGASSAAGLAALEVQSLAMASAAATMAGDPAAANRLAAAAAAVADGLDDFAAAIAVLQARALAGLSTGDVGAVDVAAAEGVRLSRAVGDLYALDMMLMNLGLAALMAGRDAGSHLVEALPIARRLDDRVAQYGLLYALACHAAATPGNAGLAARLLGAAEAAQAELGANLLPYLAPLVDRARTSTAAALGAAAYGAAVEEGRSTGRETAMRLALGERAPEPAGREPSPLAKREAEVGRLVAEGLSNREIAARLFISGHTVDTHVRHILTKLGFTTRAQIAAWVATTPGDSAERGIR